MQEREIASIADDNILLSHEGEADVSDYLLLLLLLVVDQSDGEIRHLKCEHKSGGPSVGEDDFEWSGSARHWCKISSEAVISGLRSTYCMKASRLHKSQRSAATLLCKSSSSPSFSFVSTCSRRNKHMMSHHHISRAN